MGDGEWQWPQEEALRLFHYECLQGVYFSRDEPRPHGRLLYSESIRDSYYNFYAASSASTRSEVEDVARELRALDRIPATYVVPSSAGDLPANLLQTGWTLWATDSWLGLKTEGLNSPVILPSDVELEYVDERGVEPYVAAFSAAYSGDTPDDPYGTLDEGYVRALRRSFTTRCEKYERRYIQAVEANSVIGVAMVAIAGDLAGIYGVGVVPAARHRGIGRALTDQLAKDAAERGVRGVFLQTEAKSAVEHWYMSFGYQHLFDASYLVSSDADADAED